MKNRNFIITVCLLGFIAACSLPFYYSVPKAEDEADITVLSSDIGDWKGRDLEVEERAYEILETRNLVMREYESAQGDKVYLYIVYSQDNRKVSHPPDICLEGGGMVITDKKVIPFDLSDSKNIQVNRFIVEKGKFRNLVIYWYKSGPRYTVHYLRQQLGVALDRLTFKRSSGALIRLSTEIIGDEPEDEALRRIAGFCRQLYPHIVEVIP